VHGRAADRRAEREVPRRLLPDLAGNDALPGLALGHDADRVAEDAVQERAFPRRLALVRRLDVHLEALAVFAPTHLQQDTSRV
jgi:hypothetical protein